MTLNIDDVYGLAALCKLQLDETEAKKMLTELNTILQYVDTLQSVDLTGYEPTAQVTGLVNVMREDTIQDLGANREQLLANAPAQQDGYFKVKRVL